MSLSIDRDLSPADAANELANLHDLIGGDAYLSVAGGPDLAWGAGFGEPPLAAAALTICSDLRDLQAHTDEILLLPALAGVTPEQAREVHRLAEIYRGTAERLEWTSLQIPVTDPTVLRQLPLDGSGALVLHGPAKFDLGEVTQTITRPLATQWHGPVLAGGLSIEEIREGETIHLVPAEQPGLVITAAVVDG